MILKGLKTDFCPPRPSYDIHKQMYEILYFYSMEILKITGEYIQLLQLIKVKRWMNTGGEGKYLVDEGLIKLNGQVETRYRAKLKPGDVIEYDGQQLKIE
jgi:ribosome-associated protein